MQITNLTISNFKSIKYLELKNLPQMVVIAGPNGSGKSTVFDAIRLLKSVYGGYQPNEWQQWFNEFQLTVNRNEFQINSLFQNNTLPLEISADFSISADEKSYIKNNIDDLLTNFEWDQVLSNSGNMRVRQTQAIASQLQSYSPIVEKNVNEGKQAITNLIDDDLFYARLIIPPESNKQLDIFPSQLLQLLFSIYIPQKIGVIEFQAAQRTYQREQIGGINLNIQSSEQQSSQNALYNYTNKYTNIKSELAASYIREIIANLAGADISESQSLVESLKELFVSFFPGKKFKGIIPTNDGKILFPVLTEVGTEHDINDLSSGEKEILYGYLKLFNLRPKHSVLLIDEPELHLNPRMIQGLPQFYKKYLGISNDNQIWLLTHSDAMLRESLSIENTDVYHMRLPETVLAKENQILKIEAHEEIQKAILDLVGDLASYKPNAKVVIFEGSDDVQFDIFMVGTLFPEFMKLVNPISGSNKEKVSKLQSLLSNARKKGAISEEFYSIVDKDSDDETNSESNTIPWDVYHIENYLLNDSFIEAAIFDLLGNKFLRISANEMNIKLKEYARQSIPILLSHRLRKYANFILMNDLSLGFEPNSDKPSEALYQSISKTKERMLSSLSTTLSLETLENKEKEIKESFEEDLNSDKWKSSFRGRDILKRVAYEKSIKYEILRNTIIAKMRDESYKPEGMKKTLSRIINEF